MTEPKRAAEHYAAGNLEAARLIQADVARYGGPDSLMARWAEMVIERSEAPPENWEAGELFQQAVA
jgi:hypothetical protein